MSHPIHKTLRHLDTLSPAQQWDTFLALQCDGIANVKEPRGKADNWDPQVYTITCHGVTATGFGQKETLRNWIKVATVEAGAWPDLDPLLEQALEIIEGGIEAPLAETVEACRLVGNSAESVGPMSAALAQAILTKIAQQHRCAAEDLPKGARSLPDQTVYEIEPAA